MQIKQCLIELFFLPGGCRNMNVSFSAYLYSLDVLGCVNMYVYMYICLCVCFILSTKTGKLKKRFSINNYIFILDFLWLQSLHDDLMNGRIRSNRMYLWQNPATSLKLKQHLKPRRLHFSVQRVNGNVMLSCIPVCT